MNNFINLTQPQISRLNNILMRYVLDSEGNPIPPFMAGTTEYLDATQNIFMVDEYINKSATESAFSQDDRDFVAALLTDKKTYDEAVIAGWITPLNL
jgi:hypothetical protein